MTRPGEALERADRLPVVAELGVVVVLDDQPVRAVGPGHERGPTLRRQHAAGRVLVGGGHEHRVDVRARRAGRPDPRLVDRDPDDLEAAPLDDRRRYSGSDGSSTAIRRAPPGGQRLRGQAEALGEAGATRRSGRASRPSRGPG